VDASQIKFLQRLIIVLKPRKCAYSAKQSCAESCCSLSANNYVSQAATFISR